MILSYQEPNGSHKMLRLKTVSAAKPITMGRSKEADITVEDNSCSRIHCAIRYWDDIFIVRDMHSRNGTFLNGEKIKVAQLDPGDVIKIGDTEFHAAAEEGSNADVTLNC